jgi:hypothetical protein
VTVRPVKLAASGVAYWRAAAALGG